MHCHIDLHISVFDELPDFRTKKKTARNQEQQINTKLCLYHRAPKGLICRFFSFHKYICFYCCSVIYFSLPVTVYWGWDSSVGVATSYGLDGPGIESRWEARFSTPVQTGPGAHPAFCATNNGSFPGVKRSGRGVDHPPPHLAPRLKEE